MNKFHPHFISSFEYIEPNMVASWQSITDNEIKSHSRWMVAAQRIIPG